MTSKFLSAAALALMGTNTLSAQAPVTALCLAGAEDSNLNNLVSQLGQNALQVLLCVVGLMGLAWFFSIWNACVGMNKKQKTTHVSSLLLLIVFAAGMSVFGSSCTMAQQARAADIHTARAAGGSCQASCHSRPHEGNSGTYNQYQYSHPSTGSGMLFCKLCGRRTYQ
jgi:hypothetical protein